jgi:hypothetical protein
VGQARDLHRAPGLLVDAGAHAGHERRRDGAGRPRVAVGDPPGDERAQLGHGERHAAGSAGQPLGPADREADGAQPLEPGLAGEVEAPRQRRRHGRLQPRPEPHTVAGRQAFGRLAQVDADRDRRDLRRDAGKPDLVENDPVAFGAGPKSATLPSTR